ncbi:hypothetical protein AKJ09_07671 [Labilithrix luteola]|uniref:Uncharacterized protein n=1 Tax=Labilithrix luteola TaxID=1391654 RepID=A0A0K1Q5J4_9BACT|nr:hypothetical protein AKJ09_07671 [Labilithrix luteola]
MSHDGALSDTGSAPRLRQAKSQTALRKMQIHSSKHTLRGESSARADLLD